MNKRYLQAALMAFAGAPWLPNPAHAAVKLPAIFSDHLVLQAGAAVPVWGWAEPGEEVAVSIAGQTQTAKADADGRWSVKLAELKASAEPQVLTAKGKNTLTVNDVLIGEVWLASGQSNMAFTVKGAMNAEQETAAANFPRIRMFTVAGSAQRTPQADCRGTWKLCAPETVGAFSAVAYFFGRELHQKLGVPVGLVNSSVGGTDIAAWTSEEVQLQIPELKTFFESWVKQEQTYDPATAQAAYDQQVAAWQEKVEKTKAAGQTPPGKPRPPRPPATDPNFPANLFNGMIAPLIPYAFHGVIWYQGEHNSSNAVSGLRYRIQLPLLIEDWRKRWNAELPFAWVQLPGLEGSGDGRLLVREAMLQGLAVPKTGMAVTVDIGEPHNNHPKNKQEVGHRLAQWALGAVYEQKVPSTSSPLPARHETRGHEIVVKFTHADGGLVAKDGDLKGFLIAGDDHKWVAAQAKIEGDSVIVSNPDVPEPTAVRYAWAGNPDGNLFNGAGLPASPFRTDR